MILPLLVLPFITLGFWALGGGQASPVILSDKNAGLQLELPGAHFDPNQQEWDKFTLYEQARKDSIKAEEIRRNDPYYVISNLQATGIMDTLMSSGHKLNTTLSSNKKYSAIDQDAELINQKINQLTWQLNQPSTNEVTPIQKAAGDNPSEISPDIIRLEKLMDSMSAGSTTDPEMQQMNGLLEKILDVQHPDRVKEKIRAQSLQHKTQVLPVANAAFDDPVTLMNGSPISRSSDSAGHHTQTQNSFYGLEDELSLMNRHINAIDAVVHETQTVVAGSILKLRLLSPVYIQGQWISKDQFVYGVCAINGERLTITIQSIRDEHALYPVALSVYDLDGMEGINIPGAISRDAAKQATSQSIQDVQLYSMNNTLEVQAATAGLEAAKGLFSKKAKLIKVTVKAGYQVLLRDTNQRNDN